MAKVDVEVISGVVDGKKKGAKLSIEERSANKLSDKGFVKILPKPKAPAKKKTAAKKQTKATKEKTTETPSKGKNNKDEK